MRKYEMMVIIHPRNDERAAQEVTQQLTDLLHSQNGVVKKIDVWGRRRLAYAIKNQVEGTYVLFKIDFPPANLREIEFSLKLNEEILRYMIVVDVFEDEAPEEEIAVPAGQATAPEAEAAATDATDATTEDTDTSAEPEETSETEAAAEAETTTPVAEADTEASPETEVAATTADDTEAEPAPEAAVNPEDDTSEDSAAETTAEDETEQPATNPA